MPAMYPVNSAVQPIHHNNSACEDARRIEPRHVQQGTSGKPLCKTCAELNRRDA